MRRAGALLGKTGPVAAVLRAARVAIELRVAAFRDPAARAVVSAARRERAGGIVREQAARRGEAVAVRDARPRTRALAPASVVAARLRSAIAVGIASVDADVGPDTEGIGIDRLTRGAIVTGQRALLVRNQVGVQVADLTAWAVATGLARCSDEHGRGADRPSAGTRTAAGAAGGATVAWRAAAAGGATSAAAFAERHAARIDLDDVHLGTTWRRFPRIAATDERESSCQRGQRAS